MQLIVVHQILIGSAIGLALLFGFRAVVLFAKHGHTGDLLLAAASVAVAALLGLYLRKVRAKWRAAGEGEPPSDRPV